LELTEEQLETWSHRGAVATAKSTADAIKNSLASSWRLSGKDFEVYLQGSYKNDTNIRGDSDVDIVAQLNSTICQEVSELSALAQLAVRLPPASYLWQNFRDDVYKSLCEAYGTFNVLSGHNCIKVKAGSGRLPADVVPSILYRRYTPYAMYVDGIWFCSASNDASVVNYPKQHYSNSVLKNGVLQTNSRYKPVVRMFKNARSYLVSRAVIAEDLAPSYFLESLIYNVPDDRFHASYLATYRAVVEWLRDRLDGTSAIVWPLSPLTCQNGQVPLFGATAQQWKPASAQRIVSELIDLWNRRY
jgi:hypothetical protein